MWFMQQWIDGYGVKLLRGQRLKETVESSREFKSTAITVLVVYFSFSVESVDRSVDNYHQHHLSVLRVGYFKANFVL